MSGACRFTLRVDGAPTPAHTTIRLFVNGASAGLLTLRTDEYRVLAAYLGDRDAIVDILEALANAPGSSDTNGLAHRAARLLGKPCAVVCCDWCAEEREDAAEERAHYGSAA